MIEQKQGMSPVIQRLLPWSLIFFLLVASEFRDKDLSGYLLLMGACIAVAGSFLREKSLFVLMGLSFFFLAYALPQFFSSPFDLAFHGCMCLSGYFFSVINKQESLEKERRFNAYWQLKSWSDHYDVFRSDLYERLDELQERQFDACALEDDTYELQQLHREALFEEDPAHRALFQLLQENQQYTTLLEEEITHLEQILVRLSKTPTRAKKTRKIKEKPPQRQPSLFEYQE